MTNLLLINILHIFNDGYEASFIMLLPFMAKDIHINLTQVGTLGSMIFLFQLLFALPSGYLGTKFNGIKVVIAALFVYAAGFLLTVFVSSYLTLLIPFVLVAAALGIFHPIAFSLVTKEADKNKRGQQLGDFTAIGDIGRVGMTVVISFIAVVIGWRLTSFIYGLIAMFIGLGIIVLYRKHKNILIKKQEKINDISFSILFKNKLYLLSITIGFFDILASSSLFIFIPFLLLKKGIDPSILSSFTAAFFVGNLLGKSVIGRITDKFGAVQTFIATELLMAVFIFLLTATNSLISIIVFSIVLGALTKGTIPARVSMGASAVEHHGRYEKAFALSTIFTSIASTSGPTIYGRLADIYGIYFTFYASAVFAVLAVVPAVYYQIVKNKT